MRRTSTKQKVARRVRIFRTITVEKTVIQCERPYVLFGEELRRQRLSKDWTQQELADKLKVSRGSIANIEVGRQRVLLSDLFDFADALGIKPRIFFNAVQE